MGLAEAASTEEAAAALSTVLAGEPEAERIAAATGSLIGLNADPHDQDQLFWAVRKTFEALARGKPLILVLDDIHWGEPTFLAEAIRDVAESGMRPFERFEYDAAVAALGKELEAAALESAWADGRRLTSDEASRLALSPHGVS